MVAARGPILYFTAIMLESSPMSCDFPAAVAPNADQQRWDERYLDGRGLYPSEIMPWMAAQQAHLQGGRALDVACGLGRHSLWLAELGYQVDAVDVSAVALSKLNAAAAARGLGHRIRTQHADLTIWRPQAETYDLALVSLYLERSLLPALNDALKAGGLILYTTFNTDLLQLRPGDNPAYLLQPGELLAAFPGWQILAYEERRLPPDGKNTDDCMSALLAKKVGKNG